MAEISEKTIADELREAAARVREAATGTSGTPWRTRTAGYDDGTAVVAVGGRLADGFDTADARWIALASPALAEPLASWLEKTAHIVDSFRLPSHPEHEPCDDPCCYTAHHALAVARALNGTAP